MLRDHLFHASRPDAADGWRFTVRGQVDDVRGPFVDRATAERARLALFQRWRDRARDLGGWASRLTDRRWVIVLPDSVPCLGLPLNPAPCARHTRF